MNTVNVTRLKDISKNDISIQGLKTDLGYKIEKNINLHQQVMMCGWSSTICAIVLWHPFVCSYKSLNLTHIKYCFTDMRQTCHDNHSHQQ